MIAVLADVPISVFITVDLIVFVYVYNSTGRVFRVIFHLGR